MEEFNNKTYFTLKEAAKLFGYSPDYLGFLVRKRKIKGKRTYNTRWQITKKELLTYCKERKKKIKKPHLFNKKLTLKQASRISGYSPDYIGQLLRTEKLKGKRIKTQVSWLVEKQNIENYRDGREERQSNTRKPLRFSFIKVRRKKLILIGRRLFASIFVLIYFISGIAPTEFLLASIGAFFIEEPKTINLYSQLTEGDWQNPQNSQGPPDLSPNKDITSFSESNSAVYQTGPLNLVLKDFDSQEDTSNYLFSSAQIKISFAIGEKEIDLSVIEEPEQETTTSTEEQTSFWNKIKQFFNFLLTRIRSIVFKALSIAKAEEEQVQEPQEPEQPDEPQEPEEIEENPPAEEEEQSTIGEDEESPLDQDTWLDEIIEESEEDEQPPEETEEEPSSDDESMEGETEEVEEEEPTEQESGEGESPVEGTPAEEQLEEGEEVQEEESIEEEPVEEEATEEELPTEIEPLPTDQTTTTEIEATTTEEIEEPEETEDIEQTPPEPDTDILPNLDAKIIIYWSLDNENWQVLDTISSYPLSNHLNSGYFTYNTPFLTDWQDITNLQIKFEGVIGGQTNIISYLDSAWITAEYEEQVEEEIEETPATDDEGQAPPMEEEQPTDEGGGGGDEESLLDQDTWLNEIIEESEEDEQPPEESEETEETPASEDEEQPEEEDEQLPSDESTEEEEEEIEELEELEEEPEEDIEEDPEEEDLEEESEESEEEPEEQPEEEEEPEEEEKPTKKKLKLKIKDKDLIFSFQKKDFTSNEEPFFIISTPDLTIEELLNTDKAEEILEEEDEDELPEDGLLATSTIATSTEELSTTTKEIEEEPEEIEEEEVVEEEVEEETIEEESITTTTEPIIEQATTTEATLTEEEQQETETEEPLVEETSPEELEEEPIKEEQSEEETPEEESEEVEEPQELEETEEIEGEEEQQATSDQQQEEVEEQPEEENEEMGLLERIKLFFENIILALKQGIRKIVSIIIRIVRLQIPSVKAQAVNNLKLTIIQPNGKESSLLPQITTTYINGKEVFEIKLQKPERGLQPGLYKLQIEIETPEAIFISEQEFTWGVLAINVNKSIYVPTEQAYIQMAALDEWGHTICNANLELKVTHQPAEASRTFSTTNNTIRKSGQCGPDNVTDVPDYYVYYQVKKPGTYQMALKNLNTGYEITDFFEAQNSVSFDVERIGPTRIFPPAQYQMTLKVKANQDFEGQVIETVPQGFDIQNQEVKIKNNGFTTIPNSSFIIQEQSTSSGKNLVWENINLTQGDELQITYKFDAPDISPYLFLLGPLSLQGNSIQNIENREEQELSKVEPMATTTLATSTLATTTVLLEIGSLATSTNATGSEVLEAPSDQLSGASFGISGSLVFSEARKWQLASDADTGWKSPGTMANVDRDENLLWIDVDNVKTQGDNYSCAHDLCFEASDWLRATNFNMGVPAGSTINGIVVEFDRYAPFGNAKDDSLRLRVTAGQKGDDKETEILWATSDTDTYDVYGGSTDKWGVTWTVAEINSSDFGVDLSVFETVCDGWHIYVDHIRIKVFYTESAGAGITQRAYIFENDDGNDVNSNSNMEISENTTTTDVKKGQRFVARFQLDNDGASATTTFKLQYDKQDEQWIDVDFGGAPNINSGASSSDWNATTVDNLGQKSSIAIGTDGNPVIVSSDSNGLLFAKCGNPSCTSGNTTTSLGDSPDTFTSPSVAIGTDGNPVVSYVNNFTEVMFAKCDNPSCTSFNATSFDMTPFPSIQAEGNTSIAIGTDGKPVIGYPACTDAGTWCDAYDIRFARCTTGDCTTNTDWSSTTIESFSGSGGINDDYSISLAIGIDGLPVIAYHDYYNKDLLFAKCTTTDCTDHTDWTTTTVDTVGDVGSHPSIAIGTDGFPVISYASGTSINFQNLCFAKCTTTDCTQKSDWATSTVDASGDVGRSISMAIGTDGLPIISYQDYTSNSLKVAKCRDTYCSNASATAPFSNILITIDDSGSGMFPGASSIAIGWDGWPVISYYDEDNSGLKVAKMRPLVEIQPAWGLSGTSSTPLTSNEAGSCTGGASWTDGQWYEATTTSRAIPLDTDECTELAFVLDTVEATASTTYRLRLVKEDDTPLDVYTELPVLKIVKESENTLRYSKEAIKTSASSCSNTKEYGCAEVSYDNENVGSDPSIAIGTDGYPVIAHQNTGATPKTLLITKCASADCTSISTTTEISYGSGNVGDRPSIAIGTDGFPVIAHQNYGASPKTLLITKCASADCTSISTTTEISYENKDVGADPSIAIGTDGYPVIAHATSVANSYRLLITKCGSADCSSISTTTEVNYSGDFIGYYASIAIGTDGYPVIAHQRNATPDTILVTKCSSADCTSFSNNEITYGGDDIGAWSSLVIGTDGYPVIAYRNVTQSNLMVTKCSSADCSSVAANTEIDYTTGGSGNVGIYPSLAIGIDGNPVIAHHWNYIVDDRLLITNCTSTDCTSATTTEITYNGLSIGNDTSIAIGTDGYPVIAHQNIGATPDTLLITKQLGLPKTAISYFNNYIKTDRQVKLTRNQWTTATTGAMWLEASPAIEDGLQYKFDKADYTASQTSGDSSFTNVTSTGGTSTSTPMFVFTDKHSTNANALYARWQGQSTLGASDKNIVLQVFRFGNSSNTTGWVTTTVNSTCTANNDCTIEYSTTTDLTDFYYPEYKFNDSTGTTSPDYWVFWRVYQKEATGALSSPTLKTDFWVSQNEVLGIHQRAYIFENDDGSTVNDNSDMSATNTTTTDLKKGQRFIARFQLDNDGGAVTNTYKLQYDKQDNQWIDIDYGGAPQINSGASSSDWNAVTVDSGGSVASSSSIAIGSDGNPVIAYYNSTNKDLMFAKCGNPSCTSGNVTTTVDTVGDVGTYTSIAIGTDGYPVISYYDETNGDLLFAKCTTTDCTQNSDWATTTIDESSNVGLWTSIAIGTDGFPVISYYAGGPYFDINIAKCTATDCTQKNDWSTTTAHDGSAILRETSIAIGTDGNPVISFSTFVATMYVTKCGNPSCTADNNSYQIDSTLSFYSSIAIGTDGLPIISYRREDELYVAKCGDSSCSSGNTTIVLDSINDVGLYTSIAIGTDGLPVISYQDDINKSLRIAKCRDASCSSASTTAPFSNITMVIDDSGGTANFGAYTSIAIGWDGWPVISYYDDDNDNLKVAKMRPLVELQPAWGLSGDSGDALNATQAGSCLAGTSWTNGKWSESSTTATIGIGANECTELAFVLDTVEATASTTYRLRLVKEDGTLLDSYIEYPALTIVPEIENTLRYSKEAIKTSASSCGNTTEYGCAEITYNNYPVGVYSSLAIGTDGYPVIAHQASSTGGTGEGKFLVITKCASRDCTSISTTTGVTYDSENEGYYISIAIGTDGYPVISHLGSGTPSTLLITKCASADCTLISTTTEISYNNENVGYYTSIAIGTDGLPVIAHQNTGATPDTLLITKCASADCTSISTTTEVNYGNANAGSDSSLAIGTDGNPVIAQQKIGAPNTLIITKCASVDCSSISTTTEIVYENNHTGREPSLAIGTNGYPVIAHRKAGLLDSLLITKCTSIDCISATTTEVSYENKSIGAYSSLAIGTDGNPVIAHTSSTPYSLFITKCNSPDCTSIATTTKISNDSENVGQYTSIAIGTDGFPVISYLDETNDVFKVTKQLGLPKTAISYFNNYIKTDGQIKLTRNQWSSATTGAMWLEASPAIEDGLQYKFDKADYTVVASATDSLFSNVTSTGGTSTSTPVFVFTDKFSDNTQPLYAKWQGQSTLAASDKNIVLQVFRFGNSSNTTGWVTTTVESSCTANNDCTIGYSTTTDLTDFYYPEYKFNDSTSTTSPDYWTFWRIFQQEATGALSPPTLKTDFWVSQNEALGIHQRAYVFENDDGSTVNDNSDMSATNTTTTDLKKGQRFVARFQLDNDGGAATNTYKLQYDKQDNQWIDIDYGGAPNINSGASSTDWNAVTAHASTTADVGRYSSIAIGTDGNPVISYYDESNDNLMFTKCGDSSCSSGNNAVLIGEGGSFGASLYDMSIAIGTDGFPTIAYRSGSVPFLAVAQCGDPSCTSGNSITSIDTNIKLEIPAVSLAIGTDGYPMISYSACTAFSPPCTARDLRFGRCTSGDCTNKSNWSTTTLDSQGGGYFNSSSLTIGTDGYPVFTYDCWGDLCFAKCNSEDCTEVGDWTLSTIDSNDSVGQYSSIAIGTDGNPVISYQNATDGNLMVLKCGNTSCSSGNTTSTLDSIGDVGLYTSIAIGTDGLPIISYQDNTEDSLKIAKCKDASCSGATSSQVLITINDGSATNFGNYTSIAIGWDGWPVISYYDDDNDDLKVAKMRPLVEIQPAWGLSGDSGDALNATQAGSCLAGTSWTNGKWYEATTTGAVGLGANECTELAFVLDTVEATASTTYRLRLVKEDGTPLDSYIEYPTLKIVPETENTLRYSKEAIKTSDSSCDVSDWSCTTVDAPGWVGRFTSLAIGTDGNPVISYSDRTNENLNFAKCGNSSCTSGNTITIVDSTDIVGWFTSITIGTDGYPVISYFSSTTQELKFAKCIGGNCISQGSWSTTIVDKTGFTGGNWDTSIAIGTDGLPVISYFDRDDSNLNFANCANTDCTSPTDWSTTTIDIVGSVGFYSSIAIGTDGLPVISYVDVGEGILLVAKCGNPSCSSGNTTTTIDDSLGVTTGYTSLAIGTDGYPVISYWDFDDNDLKVAKCNDVACSGQDETITLVDSIEAVGGHSSIAIGTDGNPVIAYRDASNSSLKFAKCGNPSCTSGNTTTTLDSVGTNGQYTSIAIGTDGLPVISYQVNWDLKVAKQLGLPKTAISYFNRYIKKDKQIKLTRNQWALATTGAMFLEASPAIEDGLLYKFDKADYTASQTSDDSSFTNVTSTGGTSTSTPMFVFTDKHSINTNALYAKWQGQSTLGASDKNIVLQVFRFGNSSNTTGWVTTTVNTTCTANNDCTIEYSTTTDLTDFYYPEYKFNDSTSTTSPDYWTFWRVYQEQATGALSSPILKTDFWQTESESIFTQRAYIFENDDGNTVNDNSDMSATNTTTTDLKKGQRFTVRFQLDNAGTAATNTYKLQYDKQDNQWININYGGAPNINSGASSSDWNAVTVDEVGDVGMYNSITIGTDGNPLIAASSDTELKFVRCGNPSCTSGNSTVIVDGVSGSYNSIAIGTDGLPMISSLNADNLYFARCTTGDCTESTDWTTTTLDSSIMISSWTTSIAIGTDGYPIINYGVCGVYGSGCSRADLRFARCQGGNCTDKEDWTTTTIESVTGTIDNKVCSSIAIGTDSYPMIAYDEQRYITSDSSLSFAKCTANDCTSKSDWATTTIDGRLEKTQGCDYNSIAIGTDGFPVISYYDDYVVDDSLIFAKCTSADCTQKTDWATSTVDTGEVGRYTSLTIGTDGLPIISYYTSSTNALKVAKCRDISCSSASTTAPYSNILMTIDDSVSVGRYNSIAIGTDGWPVISYYDDDNNDLKVAKMRPLVELQPAWGLSGDSGDALNATQAGSCVTGTSWTNGKWSEASTTATIGLGANECTELAFVLDTVEATASTTYRLRLVKEDGTALDSYVEYPTLKIVPETENTLRYSKEAIKTSASSCGSTTEYGCAEVFYNNENISWDPSLAIGTDGYPVIAHRKNASPDTLSITKCISSDCSSISTTTEITYDNEDVGVFPSLAIGTDGYPVIAHQNTGSSPNSLLITKCSSPDCTSISTTTEVFYNSDNVGYRPSIAIGTDGNPVIAYGNRGDGACSSPGECFLLITKCSSADCTSISTTTEVTYGSEYVGWDLSLAIGTDGNPVIAHHNIGSSPETLLITKCSSPDCTSSDNTEVTYDSDDVGRTPSLAIGTDGYPVIAHRNLGDGICDSVGECGLFITKCISSDCSSISTTTEVTYGSEYVGYRPSIAIGTDGYPVISHQKSGSPFTLLITKCSSPDCTSISTTTEVTYDNEAVGYESSLAIGIDGYPIIAHRNLSSSPDTLLITKQLGLPKTAISYFNRYIKIDAQIKISRNMWSGTISEGPNSPQSAENEDVSPFGEPWINPDDAKTQNNTYADVDIAFGELQSDYLKVTDFGFSIPGNAIIEGIKVEIDRMASDDSTMYIRDGRISLVRNGTTTAESKGDASHWPTSDTNSYKSYGGASDLWSQSWSPSDINGADFGMVAQAAYAGSGDPLTAYIDHIQITVYYETPALYLEASPAIEDGLQYKFDKADYQAAQTSGDTSFTNVTSTGGTSTSTPVFVFADKHSTNTKPIYVQWKGQTTLAASDKNIVLQVYRFGNLSNTTGWVTTTVNTTCTANNDCTLEYTITTDLEDFFYPEYKFNDSTSTTSPDYWTFWRVFQKEATGALSSPVLKTDFWNIDSESTLNQRAYIFENDDGAVNTNSDMSATNTTTTDLKKGQRFIARFQIDNTSLVPATTTYNLQYDKQDSQWIDIDYGGAPNINSGASSSDWNAVTVDSGGVVGRYNSIAIGTDGNPVVSYYASTTSFGTSTLNVLKCGNPSCTYGNNATTVDSTGGVGQYSSIAIGTDGNPVISYYDNNNGNLKVVKCGNPSCTSGNTITTVHASTTEEVGYYTSIAIGTDGNPVIAYYDANPDTNGILMVAKCGNSSCTSGNTTSTVDTAWAGYDTSIAVPPDGNPVISYGAWSPIRLKVVKCGDSSCSSSNTITTLDLDSDVFYTSLAIPADGNPVIAYYDYNNGDLKVAKCGNSSCTSGNTTTTVVSTTDDLGNFVSIAIGTDGLPVISYQDATSKALKITKCRDAYCSSASTTAPFSNITRVIDDSGGASNFGAYTSIAIGWDGWPVISYFDDDNDSLKVAKMRPLVEIQPAWGLSGDSGYTLNATAAGDCYTGMTWTDGNWYEATTTSQTIGIGANECTELAFVLDTVEATASTTYRLRLVKEDGTALDSYIEYPTLKIVKESENTLRYSKEAIKTSASSCGNTTEYGCSEISYNSDNIGWRNSIVIGTDGYPIIAHQNTAGTDTILITKCSSADCSSVSTTTEVSYNSENLKFPSLAIGTDGYPVIAHQNGGDGICDSAGECFLLITKCASADCTSISTTTEVTYDSENVGERPSLAIGTDGYPVIAHKNTGASPDTLLITKCASADCTSISTTTEVTYDSNSVGERPSLAIGTDGYPVIAHANWSSFTLMITKCSSADCTSISTTTEVTYDSETVGGWSSLAIGTDGYPVIAHRNSGSSPDTLLITKCASADCTSISTTTEVTYDSDDVAVNSSLAIGTDGYPVIAHQNTAGTDTILITKCSSADCSSVSTTTKISYGSNSVGNGPSLAIGTDGYPVIAHGNTG